MAGLDGAPSHAAQPREEGVQPPALQQHSREVKSLLAVATPQQAQRSLCTAAGGSGLPQADKVESSQLREALREVAELRSENAALKRSCEKAKETQEELLHLRREVEELRRKSNPAPAVDKDSDAANRELRRARRLAPATRAEDLVAGLNSQAAFQVRVPRATVAPKAISPPGSEESPQPSPRRRRKRRRSPAASTASASTDPLSQARKGISSGLVYRQGPCTQTPVLYPQAAERSATVMPPDFLEGRAKKEAAAPLLNLETSVSRNGTFADPAESPISLRRTRAMTPLIGRSARLPPPAWNLMASTIKRPAPALSHGSASWEYLGGDDEDDSLNTSLVAMNETGARAEDTATQSLCSRLFGDGAKSEMDAAVQQKGTSAAAE